jgi:alpha-L-rhamnosidase
MQHVSLRDKLPLAALTCVFGLASLQSADSAALPEWTPRFTAAKPVWPSGREKEKNITVAWRTVFVAPAAGNVTLRLTAATLYRAYINGEFFGHGPARGPHGYYRVDEWPLSNRLKPGANVVAIEVAGYNANSYYLLDQPSFLQAEVISESGLLAWTDGQESAFQASVLEEREQKTQRYSFQRPFSEVYRLTPDYDAWRHNPATPFSKVACSIQPAKTLLPRRIPYPKFDQRHPVLLVSRGQVRIGSLPPQPWKDRSLTAIGPQLAGYPEKELAAIPSLELQKLETLTLQVTNRFLAPRDPSVLDRNEFEVVDFGANLTGFIGGQVKANSACRLQLMFDEVLTRNDVDFKRLGCVNIITYELPPGVYSFESFEPYTLRYLKLLALEGDCELSQVYLREYVNPDVWLAHFSASDERLNRLFAAGRETYRQNAVDIFMDCPSRERAGWLCDSYFTARVAADLSGNTVVERNFLENYLLPTRFEHLPEGMLPMCYPADHNDGVFIPNWALWFVLELEEYVARSGDRHLAEALRPRVLKLLELFQSYRNQDGLLEKLPSWVFVEWSKANDFVQDVNYPSNMLYARVLAAVAQLYDLPNLAAEADRLRETIRRQSYDGAFFVDNAVRKEGQLQITRNRTEVCQYFAFYFDVASPKTHPKLWQTLVGDFGPGRKQTKAFPEVHPANAFIGNVLRLELLSRHGLAQQNLEESLAYQLYMADRTGTLWENDGDYASCNHGFASHAVHVLYRDVLGFADVDTVNRRIKLRFSNHKLEWCEGGIPVRDGRVELRWRRDGEQLIWQTVVPAGYQIEVDNQTQLKLVRQP